MTRKEEHEEKVQKKLNQWKTRLKELEEGVEKAGGKAQEGFQKALKELNEQKLKIQEIYDRLKKGGGKTYEEGRKGLDHVGIRAITVSYSRKYRSLSKVFMYRTVAAQAEIRRLWCPHTGTTMVQSYHIRFQPGASKRLGVQCPPRSYAAG